MTRQTASSCAQAPTAVSDFRCDCCLLAPCRRPDNDSSRPMFEAVIQGLGNSQPLMHSLTLDDHPGMKSVHQWRSFFLPYSSSSVGFQVANFAFNLIKARDVLQRLLGKHTFIGDVQLVELAPGVSHAADFGYAECKTSLVPAVVVADQPAFPVSQEVAGKLVRTTGAEVIHHRADRCSCCRGIDPKIYFANSTLVWRRCVISYAWRIC